jgi:hypothetical protein
MPDALPLPADLIDLQRTLDAARRAEFPDPGQIVERQTWPAELDERLDILRALEADAGRAVRQHPVMVAALRDGYQQTERALQDAARKLAEG